jgi:hypothetical protein
MTFFSLADQHINTSNTSTDQTHQHINTSTQQHTSRHVRRIRQSGSMIKEQRGLIRIGARDHSRDQDQKVHLVNV